MNLLASLSELEDLELRTKAQYKFVRDLTNSLDLRKLKK